jgi:hypothetical protein
MSYLDSMLVSVENILLVDCGDFSGRNIESERDKSGFLMNWYAQSPYGVVQVGEKELFFEHQKFIEKAKGAKPDFISANLLDRETEKLVFEPYSIKEFDGFKIGVVGLMGRGLRLRPDDVAMKYVIRDHIEAAKEYVPEVRKKADAVILLSHMGYAATRDIVDAVPGIDVAIVGHGPGFSIKPYERGDTWIVRSGQRGQNVAEIRFSFGPDGAVGRELNMVKLDGRFEKHEATEELIREFNREQREKAARLAEERAAKKRPSPSMVQYLGSETCKKCHRDQFEQWSKTRHATAYGSLVANNKNYDQECLACHTTGFGKAGGFISPYDGLQMKGVQCESCHGVGADHARDGSFGGIVEATCVTCHDADNSPHFVYPEYVSEVAH